MPSERVRRLGFALALTVAPVAAYTVGTGASASPAPAVVVPITPCRLVDTRFGDQVGFRGGPLAAGETITFTVWGTNGNCTVPSTAKGIVANVTIVNPTASSFLTLYPGDITRPNASNLNWRGGDAPTPNLVSVALSATGTIKAYNLAGNVDVIIDITGYLLPTTHPAVGGRNRLTLDQIAQLRWDQDPGRRGTYASVIGGFAMAFDGSNIWIGNCYAQSIFSKINPTTGARTDFPTDYWLGFGPGLCPRGIAYDGTNIWFTEGDNSVWKMNPDTGTRVVYATGARPEGIAYDGTNIWIANTWGDTVSKMNPDTGTRVDYPTGDSPQAVAYDGTNIWVTNYNSDTVSKLNPDTGAKVDFVTARHPRALAHDGTSIWIVNDSGYGVSKMNPVSGSRVEYPTGYGPKGIAYDGSNIWIVNHLEDTVSKMNPANGSRVDYPVGRFPIAVVYDGTNIWVTNTSDHSVSKLLP